ncbi:MAG: 2Fe-2S iron-sulfur cluster-binding protein [Hydrogenophaga sp.]|nr:2Fe-2S iron-sulfur cluster-binding protein [Hydrogenophaga sp.]
MDAPANTPAATDEATHRLRVCVWPGEPEVDLPVAPGQTLLLAMLAQGVAWPRSCRNGTCRSCLGRLAQGSVRYTVDWPGLSAEEKAEGCVLPCVAVPLDDVTLLPP